MWPSGHSLPSHPAPIPTDVRFAPKATQLLPCRKVTLRAMCGRLRVGKENLHVAGLVGAAMCSAFECGSHDRWP